MWAHHQTLLRARCTTTDNPLADFVELPDEYRALRYSNLLLQLLLLLMMMILLLLAQVFTDNL
jgi:hypothetical protein